MTSQALPIQNAGDNPVLGLTKPSTARFHEITCRHCGGWWTGLISCHCAGCHRSFTGVGAFDIHRSRGKCADPATILTKTGEHALIPADKPWPGWSRPGTWRGPR